MKNHQRLLGGLLIYKENNTTKRRIDTGIRFFFFLTQVNIIKL
jgi:hypothetical protein